MGRESFILVVLAMVLITVLEIVALWKGVDGTVLSVVVAALAALAGGKVGQWLQRRP